MANAYSIAQQHLEAGIKAAADENVDLNAYGQALVWKLIEAYQFAQSIVAGKQGEAGFDAALAVAEVLAAMSRSWESDQWETVTALEPKS